MTPPLAVDTDWPVNLSQFKFLLDALLLLSGEGWVSSPLVERLN